jgi:hypothetical protein
MKLTTFTLLCFLVGCSSNADRIFDPRVIGHFCHSSIDSSLCLDLKADHTYTESFSGGIITLGPNGEIPPISEPRESGRWEQDDGEVVLFPREGKRRTLKITESQASLFLSESKDGKVIRKYRK